MKKTVAFILSIIMVLSIGTTGLIAENQEFSADVVWLGKNYTGVRWFSEGLAAVQKNDKWGVIDSTGKAITPYKYDDIDKFSEGLAAVRVGDKIGFIDKTGKEVIPLVYDDVSFRYFESTVFSDGLANVCSASKSLLGEFGFIDKTGKLVVPYKYYKVLPFSEGLAAVNIGEKWGFIDKSGKVVIPMQYGFAGSFHEGLANVDINRGEDGFRFIDKTGKIVISCNKKGYSASEMNSGAILVRIYEGTVGGDFENNVIGRPIYRYVYWDRYGREITALNNNGYKVDSDFSEGLVVAKNNENKYGYLDKNGKEVVPFIFDFAYDFKGGYAFVIKDDIYGIIKNPLGEYKPESAQTTVQPGITAAPTLAAVYVNGEKIDFDAYNIGGNNYFKLRDLAAALNVTKSQFAVDWDSNKAAVNLVSNKGYDGIVEKPQANNTAKSASLNKAPIYKDGLQVSLTAYNINGNNYFKLRDVAEVFGFTVSWDDAAQAVIVKTE